MNICLRKLQNDKENKKKKARKIFYTREKKKKNKWLLGHFSFYQLKKKKTHPHSGPMHPRVVTMILRREI